MINKKIKFISKRHAVKIFEYISYIIDDDSFKSEMKLIFNIWLNTSSSPFV